MHQNFLYLGDFNATTNESGWKSFTLNGLNSLIKYTFFTKKIFYKKMSLKNPKNLKKMLRKSPASNT